MLLRTRDGHVLVVRDNGAAPLAGVRNARAVAGASGLACVVDAAGAVQCVGDSPAGTAGPAHSDALVAVPRVTGARAIRAGGSGEVTRACALAGNDGELWCWGTMYVSGSAPAPFGPVRVARGVRDFAVSDFIAVIAEGDRVGAVYLDARARPSAIESWRRGLSVPVAIALKHTTILVVGADGRVSSTDGAAVPPTPIDGADRIRGLVGADDHVCASREDGVVLCWGDGTQGQLGPRVSLRSDAPVRVEGLTDVVDLGASEETTCAVRRSGEVLCWGGAPGGYDPNPPTAPRPNRVTRALEIELFAVGSGCARRADSVVCWGGIGAVDAMDDEGENERPPSVVRGLRDVAQILVDDRNTFACARQNGGAVSCWGRFDRVHGDWGIHASSSAPRAIRGVSATRLVNWRWKVCALSADGNASCWHSPDTVEGDDALPALQPRREPALAGAIDADGGCSLALREVRCKVLEREAARPLEGGTQMSAGRALGCARLRDGQVACWELTPTAVFRTDPRPVPGLRDAVEVAAGSEHACARVTSGAVYCWGSDLRGQLGRGDRVERGQRPAPLVLP